MSSPSSSLFSLSFLLLLSSLSHLLHAAVPSSKTFKFVNEGEFGDYIVEYGANYRVLSVFNSPFQLCFYNTTPNAYTLALRMGLVRSESLMRWVWEANRADPIGENATLTFGTDGNLVLAEAGGRVAWQTNTANKGVVDFQLLPNGNMVLVDSKGGFVWQSFDHPTDTLLVGQSFRAGSVTKLVSRASEEENVDGSYSLVLEPRQLALYYKTANSRRPYLYSLYSLVTQSTLEQVTFNVEETNDGYAYDLTLDFQVTNSSIGGGNLILARPKYNSTLTFLRLGIDGNLRLYTYNDKVDWGAWEVTYALFSRDSGRDECQLPERCGSFGLCEDSQCVACPSPKGLFGWSKDCVSPKPNSSCGRNGFSYYKIVGVDHFMSTFTRGDGPVKESQCGGKCSRDCKCLGYFFHQDTSRCWLAYDLKTLTRASNSSHVGYIKAPK